MIVLGTIAVNFTLLAIMGLLILNAKADAGRLARQNADSLREAIVFSMESSLQLGAFAVNGLASDLALSDVRKLPLPVRQQMMANAVEEMADVGSLMLIDSEGNVVASARGAVPPHTNLADREYFRVHLEHADTGLHLSAPFTSRLGDQALSIALSRRMSHPDGSLSYVIVLSFDLTRFSRILAGMKNFDEAFTVIRSDGILLLREPAGPGFQVGQDVSQRANFVNVKRLGEGSFEAMSEDAAHPIFITFGRVSHFPVIVSVSRSLFSIYDSWRTWAWMVGSLAVLMSVLMTALVITLKNELRRRMRAEKMLEAQLVTDSLTGLANRRQFDEMIHREWRRAARTRERLSLLIVDVDLFKSVNDTYGHLWGDEVLRAVAHAIGESIRRPGDVAARYGGEEFAVILPGIDIAGAMTVAERIRVQIDGLRVKGPTGNAIQVTVSIGVSEVRESGHPNAIELIDAADKALYAAKEAGRNCVVQFQDKRSHDASCSFSGCCSPEVKEDGVSAPK
ncbi:sensor domain-containing diguanylate cyclase [Variovorax ginsengisoli]|uniref:diguanylate cyclase n=1 Tax=Variovorax ginsengisoli TaxID=363844 RepID=A0ABT9SDP3_9BURK|nr:sensor domain-containing diguanylate cyclase [Variovorax ginsengisoli]MDP9902485.1 diguanylate cyclase (GGDEF)-like protein [Variovorax ginsengisoli]